MLRHGMMMMAKRLLLLLLFLLPMVSWAKNATVKQQMKWLHQEKNVDFVYNSSLKVNVPYNGPSICKMDLQQALDHLFKATDIVYEIRGNYVLLKQKNVSYTVTSETDRVRKRKVTRNYTLSGYVRDENGETLINVSVLDLSTGLGTMTNSYGFYSITLPEGEHQLNYSYIGFRDCRERFPLKADRQVDVSLKENAKLDEVVVTRNLNSPLINTQTGKRSLGQGDIKTEYSLLSSPDVVKTLQRMSGVSDGLELTSGLYVHGGNNDENLFLLDGTPLYQINHALGLFSAFNVDMVKNVDFYKSGFPARYGGRLSSVVDVRTKDGDFYHTHGSYRIGLLDGSVQLEGPIQKGKTSFNIGLRRSWMDLLTRPVFAMYNHCSSEEEGNITMNYFFHDLNAKVTHVFGDRSRLSLSVYSGQDKFFGKSEYKDEIYSDTYDNEVTKNTYNWGNFNTALDWIYQFSPKLFGNFTVVYTHNQSRFYASDDDRVLDNQVEESVSHTEHGYKSSIQDVGYRMSFDFRPSPHHHIRFGHDDTWHIFRPQTKNQLNYSGDSEEVDTTSSSSSKKYNSHELNFYAEDEMMFNDHWSLNGGVNASLFCINAKRFATVDPRVALKYQACQNLSFKMSFTMMTQYVHKISNSFLELPTDYWIQTTEHLHPMKSWQVAVGTYWQPNLHWFLSLEGYYKYSRHLLQYASWTGLEPPAERWDKMVMDGKGRFYGMELDASYHVRGLHLQGSYTLSRNQRKYDDFYADWYDDKFDNRHKLNFTAQWKLSSKIIAFAAWSYHTGNRITVPTQMVNTPDVPAENPGNVSTSSMFVYEKPNNLVLPAYHRLDLGFDFHHVTRHGHERIWNLSLYNVYCHLNSLWVDVSLKSNGQFRIRNHAYIPVIPSFSYTIKF